jgi:hypothetical protein
VSGGSVGGGDGGVRRWVLGAGFAGFAAGIALGLVVPVVREAMAAAEADDPDARYVRELAERYGLDAGQARTVRMVLEDRDRAYRRVLMGDLMRLPPALREQVDVANRRAEERIKYVLTEEQRERFLRDSEPAAAGIDGLDRPEQAQDR